MKRLSVLMTFICVTCIAGYASDSFAAMSGSTVSTAAPIIGLGDGQTSGKLSFKTNLSVVTVNGQTGIFAGNFWSENVGWCTFDNLGADTAKLTGSSNVMPMTGFAWCQNAGWIKFNPTWNTAQDVSFTKSTGQFGGFAWSENLGWISMSGLSTDITPPDVANFNPFAADSNKTFALTGDSLPIPSGEAYTFEVDPWCQSLPCDATSNWAISTTDREVKYLMNTSTFTHDFRYAKPYKFRITDPFGNSSEWTIEVVANIPTETLSAAKISPSIAKATEYAKFSSASVVADGIQKNTMGVHLRDTYGNEIVSVPSIGKKVIMNIGFLNNVDSIQTRTSPGYNGDAIIFSGSNNPFWLAGKNPSATGSFTTTGYYNVDISSYAPTQAEYKFTSQNDIQLDSLYYTITSSSYTGVGEISGNSNIKSKIAVGNLRFAPVLAIGTVNNTDNWAIRTGYDTTFEAGLTQLSTTAVLTNKQVKNYLDIGDNIMVSYQKPSLLIGNGTEVCAGYNKTNTTFEAPVYSYDGWAADVNAYCRINPVAYSGTSQLIVKDFSPTSIKFTWNPTISFAAPQNNTVIYTSEIAYKNKVDVSYPSFARSSNGGLLADGTTATTAGSGVINQAVKIIGISSGKSNVDVLLGNSAGKIGSLTRTDIKDLIHKNVADLTRGGVPNTANYMVHDDSDYTISNWPDSTKDTIIVRWGDLTISGDIAKDTKMKGIIVLKDNQGKGGNIYITKDVKTIAAVLYADNSIISGNSSTFYSDNKSATGQLLIQGSIISNNTIGGASMTPLVCPYNITTCDDVSAKHYDLNYFRFYDGVSSAPGVPDIGKDYPFVIYYDSRLQTSPPPGFVVSE